jgi:V/A-type H+-transporting ATPase subunit D
VALLNVPPTKSSLLVIKAQLEIAREGFDLLEQKREILVMELMRRIEEVKLLEKEIEKRSISAYNALKNMILKIGRADVLQIAEGVQFDYQFRERIFKIVGMAMPSLDVIMPKMELKYSFMKTFASCDNTQVEFFEYLKLIARMAGIRTIVWRLAKEVRKTQRRVNALEKTVIPDNEETSRYIGSVLEERDRETFFIQKLLKTRRTGKK